MPEIQEYVREKLDGVVDRILEFLTGVRGYRVREEKARVPDVRKIANGRLVKRPQPSGPPCDRY